jgi:hypothetical protein
MDREYVAAVAKRPTAQEQRYGFVPITWEEVTR